jgi:hypothetical protein
LRGKTFKVIRGYLLVLAHITGSKLSEKDQSFQSLVSPLPISQTRFQAQVLMMEPNL